MKNRVFWIILLLMSACETNTKRVLNIGHRGAMGHITENTVPSVMKAMELGVDMIEIDVFKISSGEIIVFHDDQVDKLTDGSGSVEAFDLEGIKALKLEGDLQIPTLVEVLDAIGGKVPLNIELKGKGTTRQVNQLIADYCREGSWHPSDFVISSFDWNELRLMRELNPEIAIAVLTEANPVDAMAVAKELDAIAINPYYKMLNSEIVNTIHNEGYKVYTWTVNEPEDINKVIGYGVDGIFTNYPERMP